MEELQPEELEELAQELEGGHGAEESLPPEVEELLRVLQSNGPHLERRHAALELGNVGTSGPRIIRALTVAQASDPHTDVRRAAAGSLRAPVHQEYPRQHPDVAKSLERALDQAPGKGESGQGMPGQGMRLILCLGASVVAGLAVGLIIGYWDAEQSLFHDGGLNCGTGILIALIAGAVVGAGVGAVVQGQENRVTGTILGAIAAAVTAAVSWFPITVLRIVFLGGP